MLAPLLSSSCFLGRAYVVHSPCAMKAKQENELWAGHAGPCLLQALAYCSDFIVTLITFGGTEQVKSHNMGDCNMGTEGQLKEPEAKPEAGNRRIKKWHLWTHSDVHSPVSFENYEIAVP